MKEKVTVQPVYLKRQDAKKNIKFAKFFLFVGFCGFLGPNFARFLTSGGKFFKILASWPNLATWR
jgi:hypothetical protein